MTPSTHRTLLHAAHERTAPMHFWQSKASIESLSAPDIREMTGSFAKHFACLGIGRGDLVAMALPTSPSLVASVLGAWTCGAAVVLLPPELIVKTGHSNGDRLGNLLTLLRPRLLLHDSDESDRLAHLGTPLVQCNQLEPLIGMGGWPTRMPEIDELAVIQLTSGSTGLPKGIPITHGMLVASCRAVADRAAVDWRDHAVSWLPLSHDMGLSILTGGLWADVQLTLIPSECFVRSPTTWLEAMSQQRGTISPNPVFAYALLARLGKRLARLGLDLSAWRYAWAGAEPVFAGHLNAFVEAMRPYGFRDTVLKPAYGLAEAVVAVTCGSPGQTYRVLHIAGSLFRGSGLIRLVTEGDADAMPFVSNGHPLDNMRVRIVGEDGRDLPECMQGHVWIAGASVTSGYLQGIDADRFHAGWFDTGDLGFMVQGELYISGRRKDLIIRGGVKVGAQQIEWVVESLLCLRAGQVAAFSHIDHDLAREQVVVVVGKRVDAHLEASTRSRMAVAVSDALGVQIDHSLFTASGLLPKTSSGKLQRGEIRAMWLNGMFAEIELKAEQDDITV